MTNSSRIANWSAGMLPSALTATLSSNTPRLLMMSTSNSFKLRTWKFDIDRKPLVFLGARQVGKTWLIKEFGKAEYRQMAYINFDDKNAPKAMFMQNKDFFN